MTSERDPFDAVFDDAFVAGASLHEPTAEDRLAHLLAEEQRRRAQLEELVEMRAAADAARRRRSRRRTRLYLMALLAAVAMVGTALVLGPSGERAALVARDDVIDLGGTVASFPDPPQDQAEVPLRTPPAVADHDGWEPMMLDDSTGEPVWFIPCRPIHVVVSGAERMPGADVILARALDRVSATTGLVFTVEGPTDERASEERDPIIEDLYGDRWAPVLVAWTDEAEVPSLAGEVAGLGGPQAVGRDGGPQAFVTGIVYMDVVDAVRMLEHPGGEAHVEAVLLHELAHLVGLAHVDDPAQLMFRRATDLTTFGDGDLAGLAAAGTGDCIDGL